MEYESKKPIGGGKKPSGIWPESGTYPDGRPKTEGPDRNLRCNGSIGGQKWMEPRNWPDDGV